MKIISNFFRRIFSDKYNLLIFLLILFHTIFFIVFRILNKNYQIWDSAGHISISYRIANEISALLMGEKGVTVISILKLSNYYPPFVQIVGAFISLIFGYKSIFLLIETLLFFILSIIFTYKLTLLISRNQKLSFVTACIYSLFPQVVDQTHYFHLDIPLLTLILISLYFLYLSRNFKNFFYTVLFFAFFALAQITKWYAFVFLIIPVVICFFNKLPEDVKDDITIGKPTESDDTSTLFDAGFFTRERLGIIRNLVVGSLLAILIALPWYLYNWRDLVGLMNVFSIGESDDPISFLQKILYYPSNMITYQLMLVPFLLLVVSFIYEFFKSKRRFILYFLLISIPWLVFVYISNKNLRYILPLTPLFAYLISYVSLAISKKIKGFVIFIIIYLILASSFLNFNQMKKETPILKYISIVFAGPNYSAWYYANPTFYSYAAHGYPSDEILDYIYQDARDTSNALGVSVLVDSEHISAATLEMLRLENHYSNMYMPVPYFQFEGFKSDEEIKAFFLETETKYVITSSYIGPEGLRNFNALEQSTEFLKSDRNKMFEKIKVFPLPDGEKISVYRRIGGVGGEIPAEGCKIGAGINDGIESIKLIPNHTYLFFTGHFAIQDKIIRDYEKGVLYILQIENTVHESVLDVHNLPKSGSSFCSVKGLGMDLTEDIKRALTSENQCGQNIKCFKVVLVKWSVGNEDVGLSEFTLEDF